MKAHFILRTDLQRFAAVECINALPTDKMHEVIVREHKSKRTLEQNAEAWVVVTAISEQVEVEGRRYSKDVWWYHLKREYFGPEFEQMPDGRVVEVEPRSRIKNTKEFYDWKEWLYSKAAELGVVLEARNYG